MRALYFDCFSGISGDMTIAALIDVGVDFDYLRTEIAKLPVEGFELRLGRVTRANIAAAKFDVDVVDHGHREEDGHEDGPAREGAHTHPTDHGHTPGAHFHRKASEIISMIRQSSITSGARGRAVDIFEKLAISEGQVHQVPPEDVEFHEVGAIDSIVDIVGAAIGLDALGAQRFLCSPINIGGGFIHCQHGVYPVPAPATANLLTDAQVYSKYVEAELVTPTGAAILAATVDRFGPMDGFRIERVGYGAGTRSFPDFPNCLRMFLGSESEADVTNPAADIVVIEANIDDMSAEQLAYAGERLLEAGAVDVVTIPVLMKKGRPGHLLQVLVPPDRQDEISGTMFEETTTIGVRMRGVARRVLDREIVQVETAGGPVSVKVSCFNGRIVTVSPEYEDCARLARETKRPFRDVRAEAVKCYLDRDQENGINENG
jgi:uncharacterized protein (TIGR00299 family) protein